MPITEPEPTAVRLARLRDLIQSGAARSIREGAHLSIREEAAELHVSPSTVLRWENGERMPKGDLALRYSVLLDRLMQRGRR